MSEVFTDLDCSTIDREHAAVFVAEFLVWWHQGGRAFYGGVDEGLETFAHDAVTTIGGWRAARAFLRSVDRTTQTLIEGKGAL